MFLLAFESFATFLLIDPGCFLFFMFHLSFVFPEDKTKVFHEQNQNKKRNYVHQQIKTGLFINSTAFSVESITHIPILVNTRPPSSAGRFSRSSSIAKPLTVYSSIMSVAHHALPSYILLVSSLSSITRFQEHALQLSFQMYNTFQVKDLSDEMDNQHHRKMDRRHYRHSRVLQ